MKSRFCETLCELRKKSGRSQRQAAQDLSVSQALLSHYENGAREPRLEFVMKVCDYYGVSADYLLGRSVIGSSHSAVPLICGSDREITLASTIQEVFAHLNGLNDERLTSAAVVYLGTAVEKITEQLSDPDMPYDPMRDARMKIAESDFVKNIRRVTDETKFSTRGVNE